MVGDNHIIIGLMRGTQRQHEKAEKETYKELQKLPYTRKVKFKCLPCHESLSNEGRYCFVCPTYPPLSCLAVHLDLVDMLEMVNLILRDNVEIVCCQNKSCRRCREHSHQAELQ